MMREKSIKEKKEYKATLVKAINESLTLMSNTESRDSIAETLPLIAEQKARAELVKKSVVKILELQEGMDSFEEFVSEESDIPDNEFDDDGSENHDSEANVSSESSAKEK